MASDFCWIVSYRRLAERMALRELLRGHCVKWGCCMKLQPQPSFSKPLYYYTVRGFIFTSPSWLSVTSFSSQCCWTRMASQMIECYQFRCHFAESQEIACYLKTRGLFWSYLFWGSAKWHLNLLVQNVLNWLVNWYLNLLVRNVIEREIEREKVQMKPPNILHKDFFDKKNLWINFLTLNTCGTSISWLEIKCPNIFVWFGTKRST